MMTPWSKALVALALAGGLGWGAVAALADEERHGGSRHESREGERYGGSRHESREGERYGDSRHESREGERYGSGYREQEREEEGERGEGSGSSRGRGLDPEYVKECGACHVAYPPGMLPERSWRKLMGELDKHFGENAELDGAVSKRMEEILTREAGRSEFAGSVPSGSTPLRISETPKFKREHDELGKKPEQVKSMALCDACHTRAKEGSYGEREIVIPGRGRWE